MSAGQVLADDGQPLEPAVPPPPEPVNSPAVTPLDADMAAAEPPAKLATTEADKITEATKYDVGDTTAARPTSAAVKPLRKTCILKLDGCHYTIGMNELPTSNATQNNYSPFSRALMFVNCVNSRV